MRPEVSVIIPLFNAAATIRHTLESLTDQSEVALEAIVVNDGSTDGGAQIAEQIARVDARIRVISQSNQGLAAARNTGIAASRGEFLHFLDADDWLLPGGLAQLLRAARAGDSGAAFGASAWHAEDGASLEWRFEPSCPWVGHNELLECGRFQPACQIIARSALADLNFRARHPGTEDHDLWLRLAERGVRWQACDRPVCAYRLRSAGMSRNFQMMGAGLIGATCESFDRARRRARSAGSQLDLSLSREATIVDRIALDHATGAATQLQGAAHGVPGELLASLGRRSQVTPEHAAASALWMIPYADCQPPSAWGDAADAGRRHDYLRLALRWWRHLSDSGFGAPGLADQAADALAALIPDDQSVANCIAASLTGRDKAVVYGLGRPARALAPALARKGIKFLGADDALDPRTRRLPIGDVVLPVAPVAEALADVTVCIITPERDETMLARVPAGPRIIRWREVRRSLAMKLQSEFRSIAAALHEAPRHRERAA